MLHIRWECGKDLQKLIYSFFIQTPELSILIQVKHILENVLVAFYSYNYDRILISGKSKSDKIA